MSKRKKKEVPKNITVLEDGMILDYVTNQPVNELSGKYSRKRLGRNHSQLKKHLMEKGFTESQSGTVFRLIRAYPPVKSEMTQARDKTDPVKEAVKVIDDIE